MKTIFAILHNDMDAAAAGGVILKRFGDNSKVVIILTNYGRSIPYERIEAGCNVVIADFSIPATDFKMLLDRGCNIAWLDHHKQNYQSIEEELKTMGILDKIKGIRDDSRCGALLCWDFFFPGKEVPRALKLVDDYDRWQFTETDTRAFFFGIDLFDTRPNTKQGAAIWEDLLSTSSRRLSSILQLGRPIEEYQVRRDKVWAHDLAFSTEVNGKQILAANTRQSVSWFFDSVEDRSIYDGLMMYAWTSDVGKYRYSVYATTEEKPVIDIALAYNGGGHAGAAGWTADTQVFTMPKKTDPPALKDVLIPYQELEAFKSTNAIIRQCAAKNDTIALRSLSYLTEFGPTGIHALAMNHPYLPGIYDAIRYTIDIVAINGKFAKVAVGYVLIKQGVYRVCVKPLDSTVTIDQLKQVFPDGEEIDGYFWYYTDECPVVQKQRQLF